MKPDGTKEFVGATPSDAFYISKYKKLEGEKEATYEITSFSENGVAGASKQIKIQWPEEVPGGYGPELDLQERTLHFVHLQLQIHLVQQMVL